MQERTVGYTLLGAGIIIMAVSVYFIYLVFTNRVKPFEVFQPDRIQATQKQPASIQEFVNDPPAIAQMQSQILTQILEKELNKTMNVGSTIFLMYFMMLFGFRVSTLGVQLVRPIHVDLKTSSVPKSPQDVT